MNKEKRLRILEFILIGIIFGITEDLLAIALATDADVNFHVFLVVLAIAIPFGFISEFIVDEPRFWHRIIPWIKNDE